MNFHQLKLAMDKLIQITHVIFDMDGLLLDTDRIFTDCYSRVANRYKKEYTWDVKVQCMGRSDIETAKVIIREFDLQLTPQEWVNQITVETSKHFPETKLLPGTGVERLVRHLHKHSIPICVASGSSLESLKTKTTLHKELFSLFEHYVCAGSDDEVRHGKPHPDIFQIAAARFSGSIPPPENVLVFEDALNGVEAARAANMFAVAVPLEHSKYLFKNKAHQVLSSLEELKPEEWGLPPYSDTGDS